MNPSFTYQIDELHLIETADGRFAMPVYGRAEIEFRNVFEFEILSVELEIAGSLDYAPVSPTEQNWLFSRIADALTREGSKERIAIESRIHDEIEAMADR